MFPFGTAHRSCGLPSYQLDCVQNVRPVIGIGRQNYTILQIFYHNKTFKLTDDKYFQDCTFSNPIDATWDSGNSIFNIINVNNASLQVYVCGGKCLPYGSYPPEYHNLSCSPKMVTIPAATVQWSIPEEREQSCRDCEKSKGFCGYSLSNSGNFFICYCQDGPHSKQCSQGRTSKRGVVIGVAIGTAGLLIAVTGLVVCYRNSRPTSDVEQFLHDYVDEMPNRYSYSQLKKITDNFADKLGEGAYGVVYKGRLSSVGGRKNINLQASRSSQIYFPEWAFKLIENGELEKTVREVAREGGCIDDEKAIRLTKVGLWCIQHNSINRPTMRRVVQMLEGNGEDVVAPPFPFDSPPSPEAPFLSSFREEASSDTL
ncbi:hypothetical protein SUGI_0116980 [Cryptomeria japonica]|nr:hypothetical protein SUGI_0116980 [Cryptomeria japonica]